MGIAFSSVYAKLIVGLAITKLEVCMILIRSMKVKLWLDSVEKDQNWLAGELKIGKAYLSQILHNRVKISRRVMDNMLVLSRIPYESLFYIDNSADTREFYGKRIWFQGVMMDSTDYNHAIHKIIEEHPPKNGNKG